jgi:phospholipase C
MGKLSRFALSTSIAVFIVGCGASQPLIGPGQRVLQSATTHSRNEVLAIQHVIVIVQENRSFDNLFAGFPNADAPTTGLESTGQRVRLRQISLKQEACARPDFQVAYDSGKMDGWNLINPNDPLCSYTRVHRSEAQPYWDLATHFAVADHMFESTHWGDFTNQLYLIAGTTRLAPRTFDVRYPSNVPWTCDAPPGTTTSLLKGSKIQPQKGPFPCFTQFPTMANLLDAAHVTWKCYFGNNKGAGISCPFSATKYVFESGDSTLDLSEPASNILADLKNKDLANVSWVFSPPEDSDLPGYSGGPKWVSSIIAATEKSAYWAHSAIIVVWGDAADGLFYDDVPPPQISEMGLGFRVPLLAVSPYAKRGYVSHTNYQFGSILKFIEQNWELGGLGATDKRSHSIADMFQFKE